MNVKDQLHKQNSLYAFSLKDEGCTTYEGCEPEALRGEDVLLAG